MRLSAEGIALVSGGTERDSFPAWGVVSPGRLREGTGKSLCSSSQVPSPWKVWLEGLKLPGVLKLVALFLARSWLFAVMTKTPCQDIWSCPEHLLRQLVHGLLNNRKM